MSYYNLIIRLCFLLFLSGSISQVVTAQDSAKKTSLTSSAELQDSFKGANYSKTLNEKDDSSNMKTELWIGIGAAFISIVALVLSIWQFGKTENREKREELRNIVEKLIDLRATYDKERLFIKDEERLMFGDQYGKIFMVYLQAADQLIESLNKKIISPIQYFIIGYEFEIEGDFSRAKKYYENAHDVSAKTSIKNQETILRALAAFYYRKGLYWNIQLGRSYYQKAIDLFDGKNDEYLVFLKGFVYKTWAEQENYVRNTEEAIQKIYLAYETIYHLSENDPFRNNELRNIFDFWISIIVFSFKTQNEKVVKEKDAAIMKRMLVSAMDFYSKLLEGDPDRNQRISDVRLIADRYEISLRP